MKVIHDKLLMLAEAIGVHFPFHDGIVNQKETILDMDLEIVDPESTEDGCAVYRVILADRDGGRHEVMLRKDFDRPENLPIARLVEQVINDRPGKITLVAAKTEHFARAIVQHAGVEGLFVSSADFKTLLRQKGFVPGQSDDESVYAMSQMLQAKERNNGLNILVRELRGLDLVVFIPQRTPSADMYETSRSIAGEATSFLVHACYSQVSDDSYAIGRNKGGEAGIRKFLSSQ